MGKFYFISECFYMQAEEEKQRRKQQRLSEVNKRRSLDSLQKDVLQRQKAFEQKVKILNDVVP